ncbi:MAG: DUF1566 domain-containing protein [Nitrospirae bacterium]|nr:DUF1566 domain-containing protein [Nitrospirota bacterium]
MRSKLLLVSIILSIISLPTIAPTAEEVITDPVSGLQWPTAGETPTIGKCAGGPKNWNNAFLYVNCLNSLNYFGHNDWRLPEKREILSLYNNLIVKRSSKIVQTNVWFWSSTTYTNDPLEAWYVDMFDGSTGGGNKTNVTCYVWPVRAGQ